MERGWIETHVAGERVVLTGGRGVYWPARETLLVADLHLGKSGTFRANGAPIPAGVEDESLARLGALAGACRASRVVVLGDLLHARSGVTAWLRARVADWRAGLACEVSLVPGNHDRGVRELCREWGLAMLEPGHREGPFAFRHEPGEAAGVFTWAGHVHPAVTLRSAGDGVRLACFHIGARVGLLPAFSRFTGGARVETAPGDRVFAVVEDRVVEL